MFKPFSKKREMDPMEDLLKLAIEDFEDKWIQYTKSTRFKNGVSLSENIGNFAQPLIEFFKRRYLTLYQFSESIFWYTISEAISKSNTHSKGEVNSAIKEIIAK